LQKIGFSFILFFLISGCAVYHGRNNDELVINNLTGSFSENRIDRSSNLTNSGFYIKSFEILLSYNDSQNKLLGSLKFEKPDKFLITLRSLTGIEISRIFITGDSVFLFDRIKQKVYLTNGKKVFNKYGFALELIPVLLGDYIGTCNRELFEKKGGNILNSECRVEGFNISYLIDEKLGKVISASGSLGGNEYISINFDKFREISGLIYPGKIFLENVQRSFKTEIVIRKMEFPWHEKVTFTFGERYKILELL